MTACFFGGGIIGADGLSALFLFLFILRLFVVGIHLR